MYGSSYLAPAPNQAFTSFGSFDGTKASNGKWNSAQGFRGPIPFRVPNADLEPQKLETIELNYEHWFNPQSHLKIAPFFTHISDVTGISNDLVPDQAIEGANLLATNKFDNTGSSNIYGADISGEVNLNYESFEFKNWASFSYLDGRLKEHGEKADLPMTAHYKLKGGSTMIYHEKYLLTPMFRWISGTFRNDRASPSTRTKIPSYFIMDMHGEIRFTKQFSIKADVTNLFDKQYYHAPFSNDFLAFDRAPQPRRLITGSLYYKF
jgi:outer membrane receptor protein involved in Fe transport